MLRFVVILGLLVSLPVVAQEQSRTVIGPANPDLAAGADALLAGDAEKGVNLTLSGLGMATDREERLIGFSNLCAGYILLNQRETALEYCDRALEIKPRHWKSLSNRALIHVQMRNYSAADKDLRIAESISPNAEQVREVRGMLRDALEPVEPEVRVKDSDAVSIDEGRRR